MGIILSFVLLAMGLICLMNGIKVFNDDRRSLLNRLMFAASVAVFLWNFGYAWMSASYNETVGYFARSIALLGVFLYLPTLVYYTGVLAEKNSRKIRIVNILLYSGAIILWPLVSMKQNVQFVSTPYGFFFESQMNFIRVIQFAYIIFTTLTYFYPFRKNSMRLCWINERYSHSRIAKLESPLTYRYILPLSPR